MRSSPCRRSTGNRTFRREEQELGQLLRQGRCTAELVAGPGTFDKRRRNSPNVHAPVLVKSAVFGRHHGLNRLLRNRVDRGPFAAFHKVFVRNLSILVVDIRHELRIDLLQLRKRRQLRRVVDKDDDNNNEQQDNRNHEDKEPTENFVGEGNLQYIPNFLPNDGAIQFDGRT